MSRIAGISDNKMEYHDNSNAAMQNQMMANGQNTYMHMPQQHGHNPYATNQYQYPQMNGYHMGDQTQIGDFSAMGQMAGANQMSLVGMNQMGMQQPMQQGMQMHPGMQGMNPQAMQAGMQVMNPQSMPSMQSTHNMQGMQAMNYQNGNMQHMQHMQQMGYPMNGAPQIHGTYGAAGINGQMMQMGAVDLQTQTAQAQAQAAMLRQGSIHVDNGLGSAAVAGVSGYNMNMTTGVSVNNNSLGGGKSSFNPSPKFSPKTSPKPAPKASPKLSPKKGAAASENPSNYTNNTMNNNANNKSPRPAMIKASPKVLPLKQQNATPSVPWTNTNTMVTGQTQNNTNSWALPKAIGGANASPQPKASPTQPNASSSAASQQPTQSSSTPSAGSESEPPKTAVGARGRLRINNFSLKKSDVLAHAGASEKSSVVNPTQAEASWTGTPLAKESPQSAAEAGSSVEGKQTSKDGEAQPSALSTPSAPAGPSASVPTGSTNGKGKPPRGKANNGSSIASHPKSKAILNSTVQSLALEPSKLPPTHSNYLDGIGPRLLQPLPKQALKNAELTGEGPLEDNANEQEEKAASPNQGEAVPDATPPSSGSPHESSGDNAVTTAPQVTTPGTPELTPTGAEVSPTTTNARAMSPASPAAGGAGSTPIALSAVTSLLPVDSSAEGLSQSKQMLKNRKLTNKSVPVPKSSASSKETEEIIVHEVQDAEGSPKRPTPMETQLSETASNISAIPLAAKPKMEGRKLFNKRMVKNAEGTEFVPLHPMPEPELESVVPDEIFQLDEIKISNSVSIPEGTSLMGEEKNSRETTNTPITTNNDNTNVTGNGAGASTAHRGNMYVPPVSVNTAATSSSTRAPPTSNINKMPLNPAVEVQKHGLPMGGLPGANVGGTMSNGAAPGQQQNMFRGTGVAAANQHQQQFEPTSTAIGAPTKKVMGKLLNKAVAKTGDGTTVVPVSTPIVSKEGRPSPTPMHSPTHNIVVPRDIFLAYRAVTLQFGNDKPKNILWAKEYNKNVISSNTNLTDGGAGWRDESSRGNKDKKKVKKEEKSNRIISGENSWARSVQDTKKLMDDDLQDLLVIRKCKGILNKLTFEKFETLFLQLTQVGISKNCHIEALMKEVFEKATTQHHFIEMYTNLCKRLDIWCKESNIQADFRRILLAQCQASFESNLNPPCGLLNANVNDGVAFEAEVKYKTAMLGNIKFVGRLLVTQLIASRILVQAAAQLLEEKSDVTLECLCALLMATGKEFDNSSWKFHQSLLHIMHKARVLLEETPNLSSRIRFLITDVFDCQKRGWRTREEYAAMQARN